MGLPLPAESSTSGIYGAAGNESDPLLTGYTHAVVDSWFSGNERGIPVGAAPKILEGTGLTPEQMRESGREWFLDTATGELRPEDDRGEDPLGRPEPVRVAYRTYD
jgi:hypothetical protein